MLKSINHNKNPIYNFVKITIIFINLLVGCFFFLDEDLLYYMFLFNDNENSQNYIEDSNKNTIDIKYTENPSIKRNSHKEITGFSEDFTVGQQGSDSYGVNMMLMNKLTSGYVKEYLDIVKSHINGDMLQAESIGKTLDGKPFYPSITDILGITSMEVEVDNNYLPRQILKPDSWGKPSGSLTSDQMTLSNLNYKSVPLANAEDISLEVAGFGSRIYKGPFQIHASYLSQPLSLTGGVNTVNLPSKMNGYGYENSEVRTPSESDHYYFPDQLAYTISNVYSLNGYIDKLSSNAIGITIAAAHNGGSGILTNTFVFGDAPGAEFETKFVYSKFNRLAHINKDISSLSAKVLNWLANAIDSAFAKYGEEFEVMESCDIPFWRAYSICDLVFNHGYQFSAFSKEILISLIEKSNLYYKDGAYLAIYGTLRNSDGNKVNTVSAIPNIVEKIKNSPVFEQPDISKYGYIYQGKNNVKSSNLSWYNGISGSPSNSYNDICIYKYRDDIMINAFDSSIVPTVSVFNSETLGYMYGTAIRGKYIYWKMLKYAGLNVTFDEILVGNIDLNITPGQDINTGGMFYNPNYDRGTPNYAIKQWFIDAAKDGATEWVSVQNADSLYENIYNNMSAFAKRMLADWYWYTDPANNKLQGIGYLWGGKCYRFPDNINSDTIKDPILDENLGYSYNWDFVVQSMKGRTKRYGFDCSGLVETLTKDVLPNGILGSSGSTNMIASSYNTLIQGYDNYYTETYGKLFDAYYIVNGSRIGQYSNINNLSFKEDINPYQQLQSFDILSHSGHIYFFIGWIDQSKGLALTLESPHGGTLTGFHQTYIFWNQSNKSILLFNADACEKYILANKKFENNILVDSSNTSWHIPTLNLINDNKVNAQLVHWKTSPFYVNSPTNSLIPKLTVR